jgi:hypothetical protein
VPPDGTFQPYAAEFQTDSDRDAGFSLCLMAGRAEAPTTTSEFLPEDVAQAGADG